MLNNLSSLPAVNTLYLAALSLFNSCSWCTERCAWTLVNVANSILLGVLVDYRVILADIGELDSASAANRCRKTEVVVFLVQSANTIDIFLGIGRKQFDHAEIIISTQQCHFWRH